MDDDEYISFLANERGQTKDPEFTLRKRFCKNSEIEPLLLIFGTPTCVKAIRLKDPNSFR